MFSRKKKTNSVAGRPRPSPKSSCNFLFPENCTDNPITGRVDGVPGNIQYDYPLGTGTVHMVSDAATFNAAVASLATTTTHDVVVIDTTLDILNKLVEWERREGICDAIIYQLSPRNRVLDVNP